MGRLEEPQGRLTDAKSKGDELRKHAFQRRRRAITVAQAVRPGKTGKSPEPGGAALIEDIFQIEFNTMFLEKNQKFIFEADLAMMLGLIENISLHRGNV